MKKAADNRFIIVCGFGKTNPFEVAGKLAYEKRVEILGAINSALQWEKARFFEDLIVETKSSEEIIKAEKTFLKLLDLTEAIIIHIDSRCDTTSQHEASYALQVLRERLRRGYPTFKVAIVWNEGAKEVLKDEGSLSSAWTIDDIRELSEEIGGFLYKEISLKSKNNY